MFHVLLATSDTVYLQETANINKYHFALIRENLPGYGTEMFLLKKTWQVLKTLQDSSPTSETNLIQASTRRQYRQDTFTLTHKHHQIHNVQLLTVKKNSSIQFPNLEFIIIWHHQDWHYNHNPCTIFDELI